jgi:hypothetical protein
MIANYEVDGVEKFLVYTLSLSNDGALMAFSQRVIR